jgi:hypothetical protein
MAKFVDRVYHAPQEQGLARPAVQPPCTGAAARMSAPPGRATEARESVCGV